MNTRIWAGALAIASAIVFSSCSGSSNQQSAMLPQHQAAGQTLRPAAAANVKITEYNVLRGPQNPAIGPDGAVWFGAAGPDSTEPIFVYRFAANDGQGRFYALSSLLKTNNLADGIWTQVGPLVSFAGRMWIPFDAQPYDFTDLEHLGGLVQMSASGTAINANFLEFLAIGGTAVQGNTLWTMSTDYISVGTSGIRSYTFRNGALQRGPAYDVVDQISQAYALRAGPDGNIYGLGSDHLEQFTGVWKVSSGAKLLAMYQLNNFQPVDMAFGSDGAMWITIKSERSTGIPYIMRMTTDGTRALYKIPYAGTSPEAITLGHDGAVWFVDAGTNAIGRVTTSGAISEYPVPTKSAFANGSGIVACPVGIAPCGSGDIWFTESSTSKLGRIHF